MLHAVGENELAGVRAVVGVALVGASSRGKSLVRYPSCLVNAGGSSDGRWRSVWGVN